MLKNLRVKLYKDNKVYQVGLDGIESIKFIKYICSGAAG